MAAELLRVAPQAALAQVPFVVLGHKSLALLVVLVFVVLVEGYFDYP